MAVFDHEYLSDPEKVVDMQVVFVRWEEMDGLGGCVAGPRSATRGGRAGAPMTAFVTANGAGANANGSLETAETQERVP